jgi:carbamoyltransferase
MYILGVNAYHGDAAACLIHDGRIVAAVEEERFRRVKHWAGFPSHAIAYCLAEARIEPASIDHVAVNSDTKAQLLRRVAHVLFSRPDLRLLLDRMRNRRRRSSIEVDIVKLLGASFRGHIHAVEHHMAHLASCFFVSPFEQAAMVSVDGFGDFSSAAWGVGQNRTLRIQGRVYFPHSLGIFYQAITQYLGFPHYGDEYKVMGLAPYGKPKFVDKMRQLVRPHSDGTYTLNLNYFRHHREYVPYQWNDGSPYVGDLFSPALEELLGPRRDPPDPLEARHCDIARSAQAMYEEAFFNLLNILQASTGLKDLALAGGCAMNSVANGKVRRMTKFQRLYVQSAAGDAGGAIGAAFSVWHALGGQRSCMMDHAYWGPQFDSNAIATLLANRRDEIKLSGCRVDSVTSEPALCRKTASAIGQGKVIGWFQGRMEWGPRALGNRSILCDPRRADMKGILNSKIKRRESFRPFAPSILREYVHDWFEEDSDVPFMMQVLQIREDKRDLIPAVTHIDGSGRLQTVHRHTNPVYYRLISAFQELTGVPIVLNTSFNENEPIVCTPDEALDCFLRTKMDGLVIGNHVLSRDM